MFEFFNRKKEKVILKKENPVQCKSNEVVDKLFSKEVFYTIVIVKNKIEEKYYQDIFPTDNLNKEIVGFIFTEKKYAEKYIEDNFKNILPNLEAIVRELKTDDIVTYSEKIKSNNGEGIVIDYPYFWGIVRFK